MHKQNKVTKYQRQIKTLKVVFTRLEQYFWSGGLFNGLNKSFKLTIPKFLKRHRLCKNY